MTFLVDGTLGGTFPSWTTATRPASPTVGQMGYNTTTGLFDQYVSSGWQSISAGATTGSVLQVVNATYGTRTTSASSTFADTGLTASITPKFSTSKILVLADVDGCGKDTNDTYLQLRLLRGSTTIIDFERLAGYINATGRNFVGACSTSYLDSPATTSSTTYKVQFASGANNATVYINVDGSGSSPNSTITLMEIAG